MHSLVQFWALESSELTDPDLIQMFAVVERINKPIADQCHFFRVTNGPLGPIEFGIMPNGDSYQLVIPKPATDPTEVETFDLETQSIQQAIMAALPKALGFLARDYLAIEGGQGPLVC